MKLLRTIVAVIVVGVLGVLAWRFLPGCRQKAINIYQKHGGWTAEARRSDPVGFLEYAEDKLTKDLEALTESRQALGRAKEAIALEKAKTEGLFASAQSLAQAFRTAYKQAEAQNAWPVTVSDAKYSREQLLGQVKLILAQKKNYENTLGEFDRATAAIKEKSQNLVSQINSTKATLALLPAKKELARVSKLTEDVDDLLGQINGVMGQNEKVLSTSPIRTVEELTLGQQKSTSGSESDSEVKAFLESKE